MKISILIEQAVAEMKALYPGQKSQSNYYAGFKRLDSFYRTNGIDDYDAVISARCVAEHRGQYDAGTTSESTYKCVRKASALVDMYLAYGELSWEKLQPWHMRKLSPDFERALIGYTIAGRQRGMICDKTIKTCLNFMRKILAYYETRKIFTINEFTRENVNEAVTTLSAVFPQSMDNAVIALKSFLLFAEEKGMAVKGLAVSLPRQTSPRKLIREGFTTDELNQILASVDITTTYGKRDYAMLLLANWFTRC